MNPPLGYAGPASSGFACPATCLLVAPGDSQGSAEASQFNEAGTSLHGGDSDRPVILAGTISMPRKLGFRGALTTC